MPAPENIIRLLRCPRCRASFTARGRGLICTGPKPHAVPNRDGVLLFARPSPGKYDPSYATRYAALWTFGYATRHSGLDEGLYRTVASLAAEALALYGGEAPVIIDAGCGVGRVTGDAARLKPQATLLAFDASPAMLALARRIVHGATPVVVNLPSYGFRGLTIPAYGNNRPMFSRADVENLPLKNRTADLIFSVNIVDRLPHGPERALREAYRVLRRGGTLVFTDPFNWTDQSLWKRYPDSSSVLRLIEKTGFAIETWFDELSYREILDARGSLDEFRTLAVSARKR